MMKEKPNILFVCGRNKRRSPTAVKIYKNDLRINVRSAGVSGKSQTQLSNKLVEWADIILVMENKYKARILGTFHHVDLPRIENLDIPDEYQYMDEELIDLIKVGTEYHLKHKSYV
jgi:protein-tyrosine phosphatase